MERKNSIAVIKQKTSYLEKQNFLDYLEKVVAVAKDTQAEIIVGPELALSSSVGMVSLSYLEKEFESFSRSFNNKLVLPGTGLVYDENKKFMYNLAPVFFKDGSIKYVYKNSSHMEDSIAEERGLEYQRGNVEQMVLQDEKNRKNFAIEICRDHGVGKLKYNGVRNIHFQFVLANNLLGISPEKVVVDEGGIVVLAEGEKPTNSEAYKKINKKLVPLKKVDNKDYYFFE